MNRNQMKRIIFLCVTFLMLLGCSKSVKNENQEEDCLLVLNMGGEVEILETPMTKTASADDLYLLQVYRLNVGASKVSVPYASGIFDNLNDLKIYLKQNVDFQIIVSMIRNGKALLFDKYSAVNNSVNVTYMVGMNTEKGTIEKKDKSSSLYNYTTFAWNQEYAQGLWLAVNEIVYNDYGNSKPRKGVRYYLDANSTELLEKDFERTVTISNKTYTNTAQPEFVNIGLANPYWYVTASQYSPYRECYDWLYGKLSIRPQGVMESKTIELKRMGFQVQLDPVVGITDGSVTVSLKKNYINLMNSSSTKTIISGTFTQVTTEPVGPSFYVYPDFEQIWDDIEAYEEEFIVSVVWKRGIGVDQSFGSIPIKLRRNALNRIKLTVGTDDGDAGMNLVIEPENTLENEINDVL